MLPWIPAFAGMTEEVGEQQGAGFVLFRVFVILDEAGIHGPPWISGIYPGPPPEVVGLITTNLPEVN